MGVERGSSQSKTVRIFHGNTLLFTCVTSSSCHLHRGNNTNQESGSGESSTSRAEAAPQLPKTRSNQTIFSLNRSASFPFEESESLLAKLLEKPPRPYILTPEIRITVPCFVHEVQSPFFDPGTNAYVCHANGIQEFSFVTAEKLRIRVIGHHSPSGYLLARPGIRDCVMLPRTRTTTACSCFANDLQSRSLGCSSSLPTMAGSEEYRRKA